MPLQVIIQGLEEFKSDMSNSPSLIKDEIKQAMVNSVNVIKNSAQDIVPYQTGTLRRSIFTDVSTDGLEGMIYQDHSIAPYGRYIEEGTGEFVGHSRWLGNIPGVGWRWIRGMQGQPYMIPAFEQSLDKITEYFSEAIKNVVIKLSGKI